MLLLRARVAAGVGALILLLAAYPLLGLIQSAGRLSNLVFLPVLVLYLIGGILAGGLGGLWLYRRLDWARRGSYQCVGLIAGLAIGINWFSGEEWPVLAYGAGALALVGVAGASVYWMLDRTASEPDYRSYT
jgi:hypothetical protein